MFTKSTEIFIVFISPATATTLTCWSNYLEWRRLSTRRSAVGADRDVQRRSSNRTQTQTHTHRNNDRHALLTTAGPTCCYWVSDVSTAAVLLLLLTTRFTRHDKWDNSLVAAFSFTLFPSRLSLLSTSFLLRLIASVSVRSCVHHPIGLSTMCTWKRNDFRHYYSRVFLFCTFSSESYDRPIEIFDFNSAMSPLAYRPPPWTHTSVSARITGWKPPYKLYANVTLVLIPPSSGATYSGGRAGDRRRLTCICDVI